MIEDIGCVYIRARENSNKLRLIKLGKYKLNDIIYVLGLLLFVGIGYIIGVKA